MAEIGELFKPGDKVPHSGTCNHCGGHVLFSAGGEGAPHYTSRRFQEEKVGSIPSERRQSMTKVAAYHTNSIEEPPKHREVYHDHDNCPDGKRIMPKHLEQGTGGKPRCKECIKLG